MTTSYMFFNVEMDYNINGKLCIKLLSHPVQLLLKEKYVPTFMSELDDIITKHKITQDGIILMLDMKVVKMDSIDLMKIKRILKLVSEKYPEYLYKCVIYNYTDVFKFLLDAVRMFLDERTNSKIIVKNDIEDIIQKNINM